MLKRRRSIALAALPAATALVAFLALGAGRATMQEEPPTWAEPCSLGTTKQAEPDEIALGTTAKVTLVLTSTCPAYDLPLDIVFVVDRSNSMTRGIGGGPGPIDPGRPTQGGGTQPTQPSGGIGVPTQKLPPPTQPPDPVPPTGAPPEVGFAPLRVRGLAQGIVVPTRPAILTPPSGPTDPIRTPPGGIAPPPGALDPTRALVRRDEVEPPGDEDLIRAVQEAIRDFLDYNEVAIRDGRMRVAMVSFNDRARIDVEFNRSNNGASQVRSALSRVRGEGNTRIDLGLSAAQRVLYGVSYRGRSDLDYTKVAIVFTDGLADPRTTARLRQRNDITYMAVAVGRSANVHIVRQLASENEFFFDIRDRQQLAERVNGLSRNARPVSLTKAVVTDKLMSNMAAVPGSAVPPAVVLPDGTLEWTLMDPASAITVTYEVRPLATGILPLSEASQAAWSDTEGRSGALPFPAVDLDVSQGVAERALSNFRTLALAGQR